MALQVQIKGLPELQKKLNGKFLIQPEVEAALDTVAARGKRGGKGLGAKRNTITVRTPRSLQRTVTTTLAGAGQTWPSYGSGANRVKNPRFNPRRKGTAWLRKNIGSPGYGAGALGATARNALAAAARKIMARWAA